MSKNSPYPRLSQRGGGTHHAPPPDIEQFCEGINLGRTLYTFEGRDWMREILKTTARTTAIMKGRGIGWSVSMGAYAAHRAGIRPHSDVLYCTMSLEQLRYFSLDRLRRALGSSAITARIEDRIRSVKLPNESKIIMISGHDGFRQALGYHVDTVILDEAEKLPMSEWSVIDQCLENSDDPRMLIGGTGALDGSEWARWWQQHADAREWDVKACKWQATRPDMPVPGYHIPQRLSPHWSPEKDTRYKQEYPQYRYDTEISGIISAAAEIPLVESTVEACQHGTTWSVPENRTYIAGIDLAGGGADTVLVIAEELDDILHIRYAKRIQGKYTDDIWPQMGQILEQWNPAHVCSDAGGNDELLHKMRQHWDIEAYRLGKQHDPVIYGNAAELKVSKTFFCQRLVSRFARGGISLPDAGTWVKDQLTANGCETVHERGGGSYLRFFKLPGRKNDLSMALAIIEAKLFTAADEENPGNFIPYSAIV